MKIALFSPLPPEHTEIANHTARFSAELERRCQVRCFSERPEGFIEPATGRHFDAALSNVPIELITLLNSSVEVPVYNLGNHHGFFSHTWFLSQAKPGIVVLHDLKLHHFFEGIYRERLRDQEGYLRWMTEYHGELGRDAGLAYYQGKLSIAFMSEHFPMTEWAVRNALGIVVHTSHALDTIKTRTSTPVRTAPLPYLAREPERAKTNGVGSREEFTSAQPARLVIFGYLNANRRLLEFLQALATMPEREQFRLDIFGTVLHLAQVQNAVNTLGLHEQVRFKGYVSDEELDAGLAAADLAVNLRFPTMGEASASQLRIWEHALPSLVTQTEGYASMSPETVFFVRPEHEQTDIQHHLRRLLQQPEEFRQCGLRGQRWLLEKHSPATYVDCLLGLCAEVASLRQRAVRLGSADRIGKAVAPWLDLASPTARERIYAKVIRETL